MHSVAGHFFRKRATNYRALLRKTTSTDKACYSFSPERASYASSPPCNITYASLPPCNSAFGAISLTDNKNAVTGKKFWIYPSHVRIFSQKSHMFCKRAANYRALLRSMTSTDKAEKNSGFIHHMYAYIKMLLVYRQLQTGWHSISRLFLKLFQRTRILPMGFTVSTK